MTAFRDQSWLSPDQRQQAIDIMIKYGLISFDPEGRLPLTNGGTTDLKIELRRGRNNPLALAQMSELFRGPLNAISPNRFGEVPDGMSCYAPVIAMQCSRPYFTIRNVPKPDGRDDAQVIGTLPYKGERVVIIDDVVNDGVSKIYPIKLCQSFGAIVEAVIVLVDREQGWQQTFRRNGVNVPVWAGMSMGVLRHELGLPGGTPDSQNRTEM